MPPSTITRATWTDDTASGTNGTIINNARLQTDVYANIDLMFAGGGAYTTFTFGGLVAAEGLGTHNFTASGSGAQVLRVRNSSAGTGNYGSLEVGNDSTSWALRLVSTSSTFTPSAPYIANAGHVFAAASAGMLIGTTAAAAVLFLTNSTERMRIGSGGQLAIGLTTHPQGVNIAVGAIVSEGAAITAPVGLGINGLSSGTDWAQFVWGDGTGYRLNFGTRSGGNFASRFQLYDTGSARFHAGAEATPSVSFLDDSDTGWWWSAPSTVPKMSASVGGNEILRIESENSLHKPTVRIVGDHSTDHCAKLIVERKASATTAPGVIALQDRNGSTYYLWVDTTGDLRVGTTEPTPTNGDTVGTVVGTQT